MHAVLSAVQTSTGDSLEDRLERPEAMPTKHSVLLEGERRRQRGVPARC